MDYGLYQTLSQGNFSEKSPSSSKIKKMVEYMPKFDDRQKEAFLLLIVEHARLVDDYDYDPSTRALPYGAKFQKNRFSITIKKMPKKLQWILLKFFDIVISQEK